MHCTTSTGGKKSQCSLVGRAARTSHLLLSCRVTLGEFLPLFTSVSFPTVLLALIQEGARVCIVGIATNYVLTFNDMVGCFHESGLWLSATWGCKELIFSDSWTSTLGVFGLSLANYSWLSLDFRSFPFSPPTLNMLSEKQWTIGPKQMRESAFIFIFSLSLLNPGKPSQG